MNKYILLFALAITAVSCNQKEPETAENQKIKVVCTTGIVADWTTQVLQYAQGFEVNTLIENGLDPHVYKPSMRDLTVLKEADIIVYSGLHLEGKVEEVLEKLGDEKLIINAAAKFGAEVISDPNFEASIDPHYWFDVEMVKVASAHIGDRIIEHYPPLQEEVNKAVVVHSQALDTLSLWTKSRLGAIDSNMRIIITTHDALSYYARAFDMQVKTLQGASTVSEFGLKEITELVDFITENKIKTIFLENIISPQAMEAVQRGCSEKGWKVKIGPELLSDSLGNEEDQNSYTEMMVFNTNTLVNYLGA